MSFYRFPAFKQDNLGNQQDQLWKIEDEVKEAIKACGDLGLAELNHGYGSNEASNAMDEYGMELLDIIHATETALRMEFTDDEVEQLRAKVIEKNARRGMYGGQR